MESINYRSVAYGVRVVSLSMGVGITSGGVTSTIRVGRKN